MHQQPVVRRCGQGLRRQDTSLKVVDIIIKHRCEVFDSQNHPGIFITDFNTHTLGALENVLPAEEIERPARPEEFIALRYSTRVSGKPVQKEAGLAKACSVKGLKMQVGTVQPTVHVRQVIIGILDLKVAPEPVGFFFFYLNVELTIGRRIFHDSTVITEGRVVVIRIHSAEQSIRRLVHEIGEDLVQRPFPRIGARRKRPAIIEFAVGIERQATLETHVFTILGFIRCKQLGRPVGLITGQGQVGDPHSEPVALFQRQVTQEQLSVAELVQDGHFDGMHAIRQDFFSHKTAFFVHRYGISGKPHPVSLWNCDTVDLHRTATQWNIVTGDTTLTIAGQQFFAGIRFGNRRIDLICHPKGLGSCLVKTPLVIIYPHQIFQLTYRRGKSRKLRLPLSHAVSVHGDDIDGVIAHGLRCFEYPDLRPLNKAAIIGVQTKTHQIFGKQRIFEVLITDRERPGGHVQSRFQLKAVVLELDLGVFKGDVCAALHI